MLGDAGGQRGDRAFMLATELAAHVLGEGPRRARIVPFQQHGELLAADACSTPADARTRLHDRAQALQYGIAAVVPAIIIGEFIIAIIFNGFVALGAPTTVQNIVTGAALLAIVALTARPQKGAIAK